MSPPISGGTKTAQRIDPFPTFKFCVEVEGLIKGEFTECSGLEVTNEIFEYKEGGLNEYTHKLPGRTKMSNVTLKHGFATSNDLYNWYKGMKESLMADKAVTFRKVTITLRTTVNQEALMIWTLDKAFPVKWVGPSFKVGEAAVAIESLEFAHHGILLS